MPEPASCSPVQCYEPDSRVFGKKSGEVIVHRVPNPQVCTPFAAAGVYHIPERDPAIFELYQAGRIRECAVDCKDCLCNLPEMVSGVPVVFTGYKRLPARKTAKNENLGNTTGDRGKTGDALQR